MNNCYFTIGTAKFLKQIFIKLCTLAYINAFWHKHFNAGNFFFFVTATAVKWGTKDLAKWRRTGGLGAKPPAVNRFLQF